MDKKELTGIAQTWNEVEQLEQRETKPREHINASDIGTSFLDRWYKMKGVQPSNPYDARTLRIFGAGNTFEDLVIEVFAKAEVLIDTQGRVEIPATEKTLQIVGHYDAKIGGFTNWEERKAIFQKRIGIEERVLKEIEGIYGEQGLKVPIYHYRFSRYVRWQGEKILNGLAEKYPKGMPEPIIVEIKSINSNAFWNKKDYIGAGYPHHRLQLLTYLKGLGLQKGILLYISKDDLSLEEGIIEQGMENLEEEWKRDVEDFSAYWIFDKKPDPEPELIFDEKKGKNGLWAVNWKLGRSPYLTLITGYKDQKEYEKKAKEKATPLNRKLGRQKRSETKLNNL